VKRFEFSQHTMPKTRPLVKICCISSQEEAALAVACGADVLGLVSRMPSGPGVIDEALIAHIARATPAPTRTFLLTAHQLAEPIIEQVRRCQPTTVQLVDAVPLDQFQVLRKQLPKTELVQVIHVEDERAIQQAQQVAPWVDALLLDSGRPSAVIKELGGTGRTHNWALSAQIAQAVNKPVYLAGGLRPDNVGEALSLVQPYGLDLCSGVRHDGRLDETKLRAFMAAVQAWAG
jgi:phosphoribosylanthranilate isomerase